MFKYKSPIALPQLTTDKFELARQRYTAEHGYKIFIPGFEDIVKWNKHDEPTLEELDLKNAADKSNANAKKAIEKLGQARWDELLTLAPGDPNWYTHLESYSYNTALEALEDRNRLIRELGEKRFLEIREIKAEKKEAFQRMLASPSPRLARNAAAVLTFIDDINDTMGTLGVVARTAHHLITSAFLKTLLATVGGWAFTAAELTSIVMTLARNPIKAKRLQHVVHGGLHGNPPSRKIRARVKQRFARHGIGHGEVIEALQVTDNMFGIGLCLGPIFALLYDIPSGIYKHIRGEHVEVHGLPRPLLWFDEVWSRNLKSLAELSIVAEEWMDGIVGKGMVAAKMCTDMIKQMYGSTSALASLPPVADLETPILMPKHPLTEEVIREEVPNIDDYMNWPSNGQKWKAILDHWNNDVPQIQEQVKGWLARNAFDMESYLCSQNAIESGFEMASLLDGEDSVDWKFDSTSQSFLTALNNDYRFDEDATEEQGTCYANLLSQYDSLNIDPGAEEIVRVANERCGIKMTTRVPYRSGATGGVLAYQNRNTIWRLKRWYFKMWSRYLNTEYQFCQGRISKGGDVSMSKMSKYFSWLMYYGFPAGEPGREMSKCDDRTVKLMTY
ncbi:MAG: hypothetical protein JRI34_02755 [Deltaproteobacteria bacterium]|nr:hypothetical protein [Deltaproteobacteria bacterium]